MYSVHEHVDVSAVRCYNYMCVYFLVSSIMTMMSCFVV